MDDQETLLSILQNAVELPHVRQRNAIIDHGFTNLHELISLTDDDLKDVFKTIELNNRQLPAAQRVTITMLKRKRIHALRNELLMRQNCDAEIDDGVTLLEIFTTNILDTLVVKHNEWNELKSSKISNLPDMTVNKLTQSNWKSWHKDVNNALSRIIGENNIPLSYIIRDNDTGDYDDDYESTEAQLGACLSFLTTASEKDKRTVFSLLQEYLKDTHMQSTVDRFAVSRDGRAAWKAIKLAVETTSYASSTSAEARAMIHASHYDGEKATFGIDKYYSIHTEAHNMLEQCNAAMTEEQKITDFKNGIKDNTALMYATFASTNNHGATFEEWYSKFADMIKQHIQQSKQSSNKRSIRQISQVSSNNDNYHGRGRGRGRSQGRGRGRGRDGRGRGRGRGRGGRGFIPRLTSYSPDEWKALTTEQRNEVRKLRELYNNRNGQNNSDNNRSVNSTNTTDNKDTSNVENNTAIVPYNENSGNSRTSTHGRAGDAFAQAGNNRSS